MANKKTTVAPAATEETSNKFFTKLTASNKEILADRAVLIANSAQRKQEALISQLQDALDSKKEVKMRLQDLGPNCTTSLKFPDFDATRWVQDMQEVSMEILDIQEQLDVAEANYNEWFN